MQLAGSIPLLEDPAAADPFARTYSLCELAERVGFAIGSVGRAIELFGREVIPAFRD